MGRAQAEVLDSILRVLGCHQGFSAEAALLTGVLERFSQGLR